MFWLLLLTFVGQAAHFEQYPNSLKQTLAQKQAAWGEARKPAKRQGGGGVSNSVNTGLQEEGGTQ